MQNRPKRRWLDIQIILASLAVTFTVGLWNVFAKGSRPVTNPVIPPPPDPTSTFTYTPTPMPTSTLDPSSPVHLPQVHLLLGGSLPVAPVVLASAPDASGNQNNSPRDGGGNPNPAPPPPTGTGSSHK